MIAQLGNANPLHDTDGGVPGEHVTFVDFEDGIGVDEALITVIDPSGLWAAQSQDAAPTWVACSDPDLESRLAAHYGCPTRSVPGVNA